MTSSGAAAHAEHSRRWAGFDDHGLPKFSRGDKRHRAGDTIRGAARLVGDTSVMGRDGNSSARAVPAQEIKAAAHETKEGQTLGKPVHAEVSGLLSEGARVSGCAGKAWCLRTNRPQDTCAQTWSLLRGCRARRAPTRRYSLSSTCRAIAKQSRPIGTPQYKPMRQNFTQLNQRHLVRSSAMRKCSSNSSMRPMPASIARLIRLSCWCQRSRAPRCDPRAGH